MYMVSEWAVYIPAMWAMITYPANKAMKHPVNSPAHDEVDSTQILATIMPEKLV